MSIAARVSSDLTAAMKAQQPLRLGALRMAKTALKNKEIEKKAPLDDSEATRVLQTLVKQREDSASQYRSAGRPELAEKEEAELAVLKEYLPQEASEAEIAAAVEQAVVSTGASTMKDMGSAMKVALAALAGSGKSVDGRKVSDAVKKRLAG